jgi:hypothetical protein
MITVAVLAVFIAHPCMAQSAKFAATVETTELYAWDTAASEVCEETLSTTMKVSNKKDLLIGLSLQTGLYTDTTVKGKGGVEDSSEAFASISAQILLYKDGSATPLVGNPQPEMVVYDSRKQHLRAILGGYLDCADNGTWTVDYSDPATPVCVKTSDTLDGKITFPCECGTELLDEEIQLILETMGAHHFNFVARNLEQGDYEIVVKICRLTDVDEENAFADAKLMVGPSSLTVEQVRATNTDDGIVFQ